MIDCIDAVEVLEEGEGEEKQMATEVDHSAGHAKHRQDGLVVSNMSTRYGGKRRIPPDSVTMEGCVGSEVAKVYCKNRRWSIIRKEGATEMDLKLLMGRTHRPLFTVG